MVEASVTAALIAVGAVVIGHALHRGTAAEVPGACGTEWRAGALGLLVPVAHVFVVVVLGEVAAAIGLGGGHVVAAEFVIVVQDRRAAAQPHQQAGSQEGQTHLHFCF